MRKRAREKEDISHVPQVDTPSHQTEKHVNFFSDIQQGVSVESVYIGNYFLLHEI